MLTGGKARGGLDIIGEARNTKNDGVRGLLCAKPCATGHTTFAKHARQPQNAGQSTDAILLV